MFNKNEYPDNWEEIRVRIMKRANNRCENCGVENYKIIERSKNGMIYKARVVLTIAHLNHDKGDDETTLKALCQRCHLSHDRERHIANRKYGRRYRQNNYKLKI